MTNDISPQEAWNNGMSDAQQGKLPANTSSQPVELQNAYMAGYNSAAPAKK